jgi:hypothetical protein
MTQTDLSLSKAVWFFTFIKSLSRICSNYSNDILSVLHRKCQSQRARLLLHMAYTWSIGRVRMFTWKSALIWLSVIWKIRDISHEFWLPAGLSFIHQHNLLCAHEKSVSYDFLLPACRPCWLPYRPPTMEFQKLVSRIGYFPSVLPLKGWFCY